MIPVRLGEIVAGNAYLNGNQITNDNGIISAKKNLILTGNTLDNSQNIGWKNTPIKIMSSILRTVEVE